MKMDNVLKIQIVVYIVLFSFTVNYTLSLELLIFFSINIFLLVQVSGRTAAGLSILFFKLIFSPPDCLHPVVEKDSFKIVNKYFIVLSTEVKTVINFVPQRLVHNFPPSSIVVVAIPYRFNGRRASAVHQCTVVIHYVILWTWVKK